MGGPEMNGASEFKTRTNMRNIGGLLQPGEEARGGTVGRANEGLTHVVHERIKARDVGTAKSISDDMKGGLDRDINPEGRRQQITGRRRGSIRKSETRRALRRGKPVNSNSSIIKRVTSRATP